MKRTICLLLAAVMLLPLLASCALFDRSEKLALFGGEEKFTIVYNKNTTTAAEAAVLVDAIKEATGLELATSYTAKEGRAEIMLGNPGHETVLAVLDDLRNRDFAVGVWEGKYLIAASTAESTMKAVAWFVENVLPTVKKRKLTVRESGNYIFRDTYAIGDVTIGGTPLKDFSIVIPDEATATAYQTALALSAYLGETAGYDLPIVTESRGKTTARIRVGISDAPAENDAYNIVVKGTTLDITAQSYFGYLAATAALLQRVFKAGEGVTLVHGDDFSGSGTGQVPTRLGTLRAMFHDMTAEGTAGRNQRMQMLADLYTAYAPDVLGLQGVTSNDRSAGVVSALEAEGYAEVIVSGVSAADNLTPIFYRTGTLTLEASGYYLFTSLSYNESLSAMNGYTAASLKTLANTAGQTASVSYAVFTDVNTGKPIIVASVNLFTNAEGWETESAAIRNMQMNKVRSLLAEVRAANGLPANTPCLIGGNWGETDTLSAMSDGYVDLNNEAEVKLIKTTVHGEAQYSADGTDCPTVPESATESYDRSTDRIYVSAPATVTVAGLFAVDDIYARMAAPHNPIYAEISFGASVPQAGKNAPVKNLTVGGNNVEDFVIVVPDGKPVSEWRTAVLLREHIKMLTGKTVPIVFESDLSGQTRLIRIGESLAQTATASVAHGYAVTVRGTVMEITAASYYGYMAAQDYLFYKLFVANETLAIPATLNASGQSDAGETATIENQADLRLMFNNVYGFNSYHGTTCDIAQRMKTLFEIYRTYAPDVLGLQEYHTPVRNDLSARLEEIGYVEVPQESTSPRSVNSTPIFYNPETVELLTSGYFWYCELDFGNAIYDSLRGGFTAQQLVDANEYSKGVTWAIFRFKETGDVFLVGSTHLCFNTNGTLAETARAIEVYYAKELLLDVSNAWLAENRPDSPEGSLPIFLGGDYNTNANRKSFAGLSKQTATQSGSTADNVFLNLNELSVGETMVNSSAHDYAYYDTENGIYYNPQYNNNGYTSALDYIFTNRTAADQFTVHNLCRIADLYAHLSSDHCPVFADISFKE